jgi:hypothetical protein
MFILIGGIFLLQYLGFIVFGAFLWAIIFGLGGVIFLSVFFSDREMWWAIIPGFALISIALVIASDNLFSDWAGDLGGLIILGGLGMSFVVVYFINRENWWAIIPAGVLISIGMVVGLESLLPGTATGGLFLLGLGLTFGVLALVPTSQGKMSWAWIPAGILAIIGLVLLVVSAAVFRILGAAGLIILGGYLIFRTVRGGDD